MGYDRKPYQWGEREQMAQTHDHEIVSIYPFTDEEIDALMNNSVECVLMWATKDGLPG